MKTYTTPRALPPFPAERRCAIVTIFHAVVNPDFATAFVLFPPRDAKNKDLRDAPRVDLRSPLEEGAPS